MAPPQGQMRPGRQLAVLGAIFVVLYAIVFLGGTGSFQDRLKPQLGLDLVGGTRVTLQAVTSDGSQIDPQKLEEARQIIEDRVNGKGVSEAEVVTDGSDNIVISVPGQNNDSVKDVGQPAKMLFRKVINITNGGGMAPPSTASPSPSVSGSAKPSASGSAKPSVSGSAKPSATPSAGGSGGGGAAASATPTPTPTPTPSASAPAAAVGKVPTLDEVKAKVGATAWNAASALTAVGDPTANPEIGLTLAPFSKLTGPEVGVLPVTMQFNVPQINCEQLDKRFAGSIDDPKKQAVACQSGGKYLLDVAKVEGIDIDSASPQLAQNGQWEVALNFTSDGTSKWTKLTGEAFRNDVDPKCEQAALGDQGKCLVAVVLDNTVISAPQILGVLSSQSSISGSFNSASAQDLANKLNFGALPLSFVSRDSQSITATLGSEHLKAGLLAAGIGMLLVAIYAFFYYRLLGSVIFLSLILSGLLVFGALVVLGREMGFTLTLAGIAGFIVSLGVAADSFVIYFERLKDEIREGRTPRSAVPRAWQRARKTILTANAVSIMAAVVLYLVSSGPVKGFAFALGLATVLDLVVVFLFRHPIMTMFASTKAFLSPKVSGLGRVLHQRNTDDDESVGTRRMRTKEA
ncbi:preprotein translocase subunit SecD [Allocatelliglobosispora scoriae]|uniref:Protein translocase subunit SecD n=1 Tax=Allocatelliglobosispora scoriae TaxID=643052 RepID=A0A841BZE4_9ACTN|nr:protein translocase subunit SecD [Allocatelliglobosispora scoriae]MBB5873055.1 preprotein translocase subunit SecD [Allocatelliglobosispora scoriae]